MQTNNELFFEALINTNHKIYGYKLGVLTLEKLALLEAIKSPLVTGGEIQKTDLMLAAYICAGNDIKETSKPIQKLIQYVKFFCHDGEKQLNKWYDYYLDYFALPDVLTKGEGKANPFPFVLSCAANLIKNTGWQWDYVFGVLPVGLVVWLNLSLSYFETGETGVISDKEKAIRLALTSAL